MSHFLTFILKFRRASEGGSKMDSPQDDLLSFHSEKSSALGSAQRLLSARRRTVIICAATLLGIGSATVVYIASTRLQAARTVAPRTDPSSGTAVLDSNPAGFVMIEGVVRGQTPLSLTLPAGTHNVTITSGQASRSVLLEIAAGTTTRQYIEFAAGAAPAPTTGRLDVTSQPSGARVTVDGAPKGVTPISIAEMTVGPHQLSIVNGDTTIHRSVTIRAGATSSVDASIASADSGAGWVALTSPIELTLADDNQIIGTTKAARVMLPAGTHNLVLANTALEFQTTLAVRIEGGKTVTRAIALPTGSLSINAVPWANVWVDGAEVGTTPLANVPMPIGTHEVMWRHPQLGERHRTITITAKTPTRIGMDFKQ
jgi:PEGA domain